MDQQVECPHCGCIKTWIIRREKRRCAQCRYEWKPGRRPLHLSDNDWATVIKLFLTNLSSEKISRQTKLERRRVIRALTKIRETMAMQVSNSSALLSAKIPAGSSLPIIGIVIRGDFIWAELVQGVDGDGFLVFLRKQVPPGTIISFDKWKKYAAVAIGRTLHRLSKLGIKDFTSEPPKKTVELLTFWSFLKRRLSEARGVRRHRLPLYLAEFSWRFNFRNLPRGQQQKAIMNLLLTKYDAKSNGELVTADF
jgi:transposase